MEFLNKYVVLINSIILIILIIKYLQDVLRAQRESQKLKIEYEKLKYELDKLRTEHQKSERLVVEASAEQIAKYVIEPLSQEIARAANEFGGAVESFRLSQSERVQSKEISEIVFQLRQVAEMMSEIRMVVSKLQKGTLSVRLD